MALAVRASVVRDVADPVHHQHRRRGKLGVARAEQVAPGTGQQRRLVKAGRICRHPLWSPLMPFTLPSTGGRRVARAGRDAAGALAGRLARM